MARSARPDLPETPAGERIRPTARPTTRTSVARSRAALIRVVAGGDTRASPDSGQRWTLRMSPRVRIDAETQPFAQAPPKSTRNCGSPTGCRRRRPNTVSGAGEIGGGGAGRVAEPPPAAAFSRWRALAGGLVVGVGVRRSAAGGGAELVEQREILLVMVGALVRHPQQSLRTRGTWRGARREPR
jgi:hypothetical protein